MDIFVDIHIHGKPGKCTKHVSLACTNWNRDRCN